MKFVNTDYYFGSAILMKSYSNEIAFLKIVRFSKTITRGVLLTEGILNNWLDFPLFSGKS